MHIPEMFSDHVMLMFLFVLLEMTASLLAEALFLVFAEGRKETSVFSKLFI